METQFARLRSERQGMCDRLRTDHAILGDLAATARSGDPRLADANDRVRQAERRLGAIDGQLAAPERNVVDENKVAEAPREFDEVWGVLAPRDLARIVELLVAGVLCINFFRWGIYDSGTLLIFARTFTSRAA